MPDSVPLRRPPSWPHGYLPAQHPTATALRIRVLPVHRGPSPPVPPGTDAGRRRLGVGRLLRHRSHPGADRVRRPGPPRRAGRPPLPGRLAAHPRRGVRSSRWPRISWPASGPADHRSIPTDPRGQTMRYRWDPVYPAYVRRTGPTDLHIRTSDAERNAVADKLARHFAEGRLDQAEFKSRLDRAMGGTTRGDLAGLFDDLPPLADEAPPPRPRRRRLVPFVLLVLLVAAAAGSTLTSIHLSVAAAGTGRALPLAPRRAPPPPSFPCRTRPVTSAGGGGPGPAVTTSGDAMSGDGPCP